MPGKPGSAAAFEKKIALPPIPISSRCHG
jgi:hypothetical protein